MKRILVAVALLALVFPGGRQAEARTDISIDFFYDNLGDGGSWIEVGEYGYCWQPAVAVSNRSWRPYSDGYWAYTDVGWTWVSYEDFGWATYHYGRWIRLRGRGWVWVPGREWGPAWVSWRTGGDYVGWAPLPPRSAGEYWDERPITARVDIEFDIGPAYYNFIDVRYIGEPVLRERIFAPEQNVTYLSRTVNVTNITYTNSTVYNYGPDYNTISRYSTRPIQRLSLQRETNVDPTAAAQPQSLMKVQGDKLVVAAPQQLQKPAKPVAPKVLKEKVVLAQAPVERGWEGGDQKAQAELKEKMKQEDPKSVPPPTVQASDKPGASPAATSPATAPASGPPTTPGASVTPTTNAAPTAGTSATPAAAPPVSPAKNKDKGKNRRDDKVSPASVSPATSPGTAPATEKNKNKRNEKEPPSATPSASVPAATTPMTTPPPARDKGKNKQKESVAPSTTMPPSSGTTETSEPSVAPKRPKEKPDKKLESSAPPPRQSAPRVAQPPTPDTRSNRTAPETTKPEAAVEKPKHQGPADVSRPKKEEAAPPPPSNAPANPPPAREEGKKKKKDEPGPGPKP